SEAEPARYGTAPGALLARRPPVQPVASAAGPTARTAPPTDTHGPGARAPAGPPAGDRLHSVSGRRCGAGSRRRLYRVLRRTRFRAGHVVHRAGLRLGTRTDKRGARAQARRRIG